MSMKKIIRCFCYGEKTYSFTVPLVISSLKTLDRAVHENCIICKELKEYFQTILLRININNGKTVEIKKKQTSSDGRKAGAKNSIFFIRSPTGQTYSLKRYHCKHLIKLLNKRNKNHKEIIEFFEAKLSSSILR